MDQRTETEVFEVAPLSCQNSLVDGSVQSNLPIISSSTENMFERKIVIFKPKDYQDEFNPQDYLEYYYSSNAMEGVRLSLFALPTFASIILKEVPEAERQRLIDIGSGPTIYSAVCFRKVVQKVYLSDYSDASLRILQGWLDKSHPFEWTSVIRVIARSEGCPITTDSEMRSIEEETRSLVANGGILRADVLRKEVIGSCGGGMIVNKLIPFDIMISIFCLESACTSYPEYENAMKNMVDLLRPAGRLILGAVVNEDAYNAGISSKTGKSKYFSLLRLTEDYVMKCLTGAGMDVESCRKISIDQDGVLFIMMTKK